MTKLLFYLGKESVFRSFFTKENDKDKEINYIIKEMWIKGFNSLRFEEI
jgi:hypothetical protein